MIKRMVIMIVGVALLTVGGICVYADWYRVTNKVAVQEAAVAAKMALLDSKMAMLQLALENVKDADQVLNKHIRRIDDEKQQMISKLASVQEEVISLKSLTKEFAALTHGLEDKTKGWIKESVISMTALESDLDAHKQALNMLMDSKIPEMDKEINSIKQGHDHLNESVNIEMNALIAKRVDVLEKQFKDIQEKELDIILTNQHRKSF